MVAIASGLAVAEGSEVGIRHASEGAIVLVLAGFAQQLRGGSLYNRQAGNGHWSPERNGERHQAAEGMSNHMRQGHRSGG